MHSFRLRYIALGLLIYIQSAYSRTCARDFDDIASNTAQATVVFEGRANSEYNPNNSTMYAVKFRVRQVLKDHQHILGSNETNTLQEILTVGYFADDSTSECLPRRIQLRKSYIVFLRLAENNSVWQQHSSVDSSPGGVPKTDTERLHLKLLTNPALSTKKSLAEVEENSCRKCSRSPKITKSRRMKTAREGDRVRLTCKASGKPSPRVSWFKDGVPLVPNSRTKVVVRRKASQIIISKVMAADVGVYQCKALNVFGETPLFNTSLKVNFDDKRHSTLCEEQSYCLNGGTCYVMKELRYYYCQCPNGFMGSRCVERNVGDNSLLQRQADGTYGKRKRSPRLRRHHRHTTVVKVEDYFLLAKLN